MNQVKEENPLLQAQLSDEVKSILEAAPSLTMVDSREELMDLALGSKVDNQFEVAYDVPEKGRYVEAIVHRVRNGVAVNYVESYMRRRDPKSMLIADSNATNKTKFEERFDFPFTDFRGEVLEWLKTQDLLLVPFMSGGEDFGTQSLLIAPRNASFFGAALAEIQGCIPASKITDSFKPEAIVFLAPTFRHTHCNGEQIVVHNRIENGTHEIFSLNLYPGPSAKKGIYGVLLTKGEKEGWITAHGSTVVVTTPYDNEFVIMHEGASGGGKSEMLQYPHRQPDGRLLIGENIANGKKRYIPLFQGCTLSPVTDDMALCHNKLQNDSGKLVVTDAEEGWFVRVDHIKSYGVDSHIEKICTTPKEPLVFLNIYSVPEATCLIWEPIEDEPGKACPNPRVIIPRSHVPDIVDKPVEVDVRSFGVRTPPCSKENPSYGIIGMLHILPPAIAWLWRMVSPRGFGNPSIVDTEGMTSEGVGSYWPFATGRRVDQANLLLKQIQQTPKTRYTLTPNQHIGSWKVGFMSQWIAREYMSRRGSAKFKEHQIEPARCSLLGYALHSMQIEGFFLNREFLAVETQAEVGEEGYDKGAKILCDFFKRELKQYLDEKDLDPVGRQIIEACYADASIDEYNKLIHPMM